MNRVVLDSNIYVSALRFGGLPMQVLRFALDGRVSCFISLPIVHETLRILRDKFSFSMAELAEACLTP